jgi:hypothetical protein
MDRAAAAKQVSMSALNNETHMNSKLSKTLTITAFVFLLASTRPAFTQISTPSASPTPTTQMQEMPDMEKMSDSVTKMSEMCMAMTEKEKADAVDHWHFGNIRTAAFFRTASPRRT